MIARTITALATVLVLAACAQRTPLEPLAGRTLPQAPYGATEPISADELLEVDTQAAPERNVELRTQSEERSDDPFDLPPEG